MGKTTKRSIDRSKGSKGSRDDTNCRLLTAELEGTDKKLQQLTERQEKTVVGHGKEISSARGGGGCNGNAARLGITIDIDHPDECKCKSS